MYLDLSVAWPKTNVIIGQILLIGSVTAGLKALCWRGDLCSDKDCMEGYLGTIYGGVNLMMGLILVWILVDEVFGWGTVQETVTI